MEDKKRKRGEDKSVRIDEKGEKPRERKGGGDVKGGGGEGRIVRMELCSVCACLSVYVFLRMPVCV